LLRGTIKAGLQKEIYFPLMALIDFRYAFHSIRSKHSSLTLSLSLFVCRSGYRLIAISLLPINKKSLIYGTADGGKTVMQSDRKFNKVFPID